MLTSVYISPQTAAVFLPCWCVSVYPGVLWPAAEPVWEWLPAPWEERGSQGTVPDYESDQL